MFYLFPECTLDKRPLALEEMRRAFDDLMESLGEERAMPAEARSS